VPRKAAKHPQQEFIPGRYHHILFICGGVHSLRARQDHLRPRQGAANRLHGMPRSAAGQRRTGRSVREGEPEDLFRFGLIRIYSAGCRWSQTPRAIEDSTNRRDRILTRPRTRWLSSTAACCQIRVQLNFTEAAACGPWRSGAIAGKPGPRAATRLIEHILAPTTVGPCQASTRVEESRNNREVRNRGRTRYLYGTHRRWRA